MKVALISCFETYQNRLDDMERYYQSKGFDVTIIKSNYLHFKKEFIENDTDSKDVILIDVPRYKKNISVKRVVSHMKFANRCVKHLEKNNYDLVHVLIPPNILCKKIAKMNLNSRIIYDVIDLWPETMPINKISKTNLYKGWKNFRNDYVGNANYVLTECDLFTKELKESLGYSNIETIYFTREQIIEDVEFYPFSNQIELVYLGSINNIIDIDFIVNILINLRRKVDIKFNIIGGGEKKNTLMELLEKFNISFIDHGLVYDNEEKKRIFNRCSFAINIMKPNVFVGLTMKSLDYFQFGIPIINNIKYDTEKLVMNYNVGINVTNSSDLEALANEIIEKSDIKANLLLRNNVKLMFENKFKYENMEKKMNDIMSSFF